MPAMHFNFKFLWLTVCKKEAKKHDTEPLKAFIFDTLITPNNNCKMLSLYNTTNDTIDKQ